MKNKHQLNTLRSNFFKTTTQIFRVGLDPSVVLVYCYMCSCSEEFNPSIRTLSRMLRLHRSTVVKAIDVLLEKNIIQLESPAKPGKAAMYRFVPPGQWRV